MRKVLIVLVMILGFGLTACGEGTGQNVPSCDEWEGGSGCAVVIQYEDEDIHCLSWDGSHGEKGLTCDFVRWHKEHGSAETTP